MTATFTSPSPIAFSTVPMPFRPADQVRTHFGPAGVTTAFASTFASAIAIAAIVLGATSVVTTAFASAFASAATVLGATSVVTIAFTSTSTSAFAASAFAAIVLLAASVLRSVAFTLTGPLSSLGAVIVRGERHIYRSVGEPS
jgi:hypothetical protein